MNVYMLFFINVLMTGQTVSLCPGKCKCDHVERIVDCASAGLTEIPKYMPKNTKTLILNGNPIGNPIADPTKKHSGILRNEDIWISSNFSELHSLQHLFLDNTSISFVPFGTFQILKGLVTLSLSKNNLRSIWPYTVAFLTNLKFLNLSSNRLTYINDTDFSGLIKLEKVDVSDNELESLDVDTFSSTTSMQWIDLSGNKLVVIYGKTFRHSREWRYMDFSNNLLTSISSYAFLDTNIIEHLNFTDNRLKSIRIREFPKLEVLDLSDNLIRDIGTLRNLRSFGLIILSLRNNRLTYIKDGTFASFVSLKRLDLSENYINTHTHTHIHTHTHTLILGHTPFITWKMKKEK